jgi:YVTN family beta-propeller protein
MKFLKTFQNKNMKPITGTKTTFLMITASIFLTSCYKMAETATPKSNITYDAAYIVNGESSSISVIDLKSNEVKETIALGQTSGGHGGDMSMGISWPHHIYLSPSGNQLVIGVPGMDLSGGHGGEMGGMKGKSVVLNSKTGEIINTTELPVGNHNSIFSPDGTEIWTSQMEEMGKVLIYDENSYSLKKTIEVGKEPSEVTFSADGLMAFVANSASNTVRVIKVSDKSILKTIDVGEDPVGAWPGKDNKMYVDNEHSETVSVIDVATLQVEETIQLGFMPGMVAYNKLKNELWVTDAENGKAIYFQRVNSDWMKMGEIETGHGAHCIAFTKDEKTAYVTNQMNETVSVIDVEAKKKIKDIKVGKKPNGIAIKQL